MEKNKIVKIKLPDKNNPLPLYCKYNGQVYPRSGRLIFNVEGRKIEFDHYSETGDGITLHEYHGHTICNSIDEMLSFNDIKQLAKDILPIAERIISGYSCKWNGCNHIAVYTDDAKVAMEELRRICSETDSTSNFSVWDTEEWFFWEQPENLIKRIKENGIDCLAEELRKEALEQNVILEDVEKYLKKNLEESEDFS